MTYQLTDAALKDIREITRHIRTVQKSPQNAKLVATRLKAAFGKLAATSSLGHVREELQDADARVYTVTGVLVIYDATLKPLTVLPVIHAARDLSRVRSRDKRSR